MSAVLQRYGINPRELSQEQLYVLALILQLRQAQEKTGIVTFCTSSVQKTKLLMMQVVEINSAETLRFYSTVCFFVSLNTDQPEKDLLALKEV